MNSPDANPPAQDARPNESSRSQHVESSGERSVAAGTITSSTIIPGDNNKVTIYQGAQISIPSQAAVQRHRVELRHNLEQESLKRWGGMGAYIEEQGSHLPIEASPYQTGPAGLRDDLLDTMRQAKRLLVLGEPGSGKTVALHRLAWELCGDPEPVIPVIVPLLYYADKPLDTWVRKSLLETGVLTLSTEQALDAFLDEGATRCCFLFDGLNEVSPKYGDRLVEELVLWMKAHARHAVILTSRAQDELWRRLRQAVDETVVIQPIAEPQIAQYLQDQLGAERGQSLFERMDERLRTLAQRPLLLWLMKEAGAAGESLPGNRGELYARFISRMLSRDTQERRLGAEIKDQVKHLAAAQIAYVLQQRHTLLCSRDEAVGILAPALPETADAVVTALAQHGFLIGDELLRFPHQTLQEHFAGVALLERVKREQQLTGLHWLAHAVRQTLGGRDSLAALARDEWWAECFIQLAGLVEKPTWLARTIASANPWLAWWCVQEGKTVDPETRDAIESQSIRLVKSAQVIERRRAVQALAQMQSDRAADILFAEVASQELLGMGDAVSKRALELAQQPGVKLYRAGLAYLEAALGQPVVYVPPGPFLMGSDPANGGDAREDEQPQHSGILPGYWIGRYPVTIAEFKRFVERSGHKPQNRISLDGQASHPVTRVTWHDAMAYCRWLSQQSGFSVTLPSEAEWEKAARGADGRIYPWGDEWDASRCNTSESNSRGTTPVGQYW